MKALKWVVVVIVAVVMLAGGAYLYLTKLYISYEDKIDGYKVELRVEPFLWYLIEQGMIEGVVDRASRQNLVALGATRRVIPRGIRVEFTSEVYARDRIMFAQATTPYYSVLDQIQENGTLLIQIGISPAYFEEFGAVDGLINQGLSQTMMGLTQDMTRTPDNETLFARYTQEWERLSALPGWRYPLVRVSAE